MKEESRKELLKTVKFGLFSISAGVIQIVAFTLLDALTSWTYWPKYLISLVLSVLWNFTLNRKFTFKSSSNVPVAMFKVFLYYLVFTPLSTVFGQFLTERCHMNEFLVTVINMIINFVTEYLYDKYIVFRDAKEDRKTQDLQQNSGMIK
ncbi:MAG: GtrA family protein [Clostridia bacterium]|nr:GtrA family protein [Clostridia bacterium]